MKCRKLHFRLFLKDIFLPALTVLFFFYINYEHLRVVKNVGLYPKGVSLEGLFLLLRNSLDMSIYCFIFFLFTSYYFADKLRQNSLEECVSATKNGISVFYGKHFLIFAIIDLIFTLTIMIYNIFEYYVLKTNSAEVLIHRILCIVIYIFCVSLVAVILGTLAAMKMKRLPACLFMSVVVFITSPIFESVSFMMFYNYDVNIYPFFEAVSLYPRKLSINLNLHTGFSLLPNVFAQVCFYLSFLLIPIMLRLFKNKNFVKRTVSALLAVICVVSASVYMLPQGRMLADENPDGAPAADALYYGEHEQKTEDGGFYVKKYDMDMSVKNNLKADVTVYLSKEELSSYKFTLYHGYKVSRITDQSGAPMDFVQNGDYIEVYRNAQPVTSLTFSYKGNNSTYYTHSQGIFLSGNFPYYPHSGYKKIYDTSCQGFGDNLLEAEAEFSVRVDYRREVFCNLGAEEGENIFEGVSDGCVIMAGFLTENTESGISMIYPYTDTEQFGDSIRKKDIEAFIQYKTDGEVLNKIMAIPHIGVGAHERYSLYSDGTLVCLQVRTYDSDWKQAVDKAHKRTLRRIIYAYENECSLFYSILASEKTAVTMGAEKGPAMLFSEAIDNLGEETVLSLADAYFNDKSDIHSGEDFLSSIQ